MRTTVDGAVPGDYYSTSEIAVYEKIDNADMRTWARLSLDSAIRAAQKEDIALADWSKKFNTQHENLCTDRRLNYFYMSKKLDPIAHLFRLFVVKRKGVQSNDVRMCAGYGIRKSHYDKFKATGKLPNVRYNGKIHKYDRPARDGRSKVEFEGGGRIDVPMNSVYERFRDGIGACNKVSKDKVTVPEMLVLAMREFMEKRVDIFGVADDQADEEKLIIRRNETLHVDVDGDLVEHVFKFLQRYNAKYTPSISLSQFTEIALHAHLERMPVELVDPKLAKEMKGMQ